MKKLTKIFKNHPKRKLTEINEAPKEKSSDRPSSSCSNQDHYNDIVGKDLSQDDSLYISDNSVSISNSKKSVVGQEKETKS